MIRKTSLHTRVRKMVATAALFDRFGDGHLTSNMGGVRWAPRCTTQPRATSIDLEVGDGMLRSQIARWVDSDVNLTNHPSYVTIMARTGLSSYFKCEGGRW